MEPYLEWVTEKIRQRQHEALLTLFSPRNTLFYLMPWRFLDPGAKQVILLYCGERAIVKAALRSTAGD